VLVLVLVLVPVVRRALMVVVLLPTTVPHPPLLMVFMLQYLITYIHVATVHVKGKNVHVLSTVSEGSKWNSCPLDSRSSSYRLYRYSSTLHTYIHVISLPPS
jgi:hypothetical protein